MEYSHRELSLSEGNNIWDEHYRDRTVGSRKILTAGFVLSLVLNIVLVITCAKIFPQTYGHGQTVYGTIILLSSIALV